MNPTLEILKGTRHYTASLIRSGCCGDGRDRSGTSEHYEIFDEDRRMIFTLPAIRGPADSTNFSPQRARSCFVFKISPTGHLPRGACNPLRFLRDALR